MTSPPKQIILYDLGKKTPKIPKKTPCRHQQIILYDLGKKTPKNPQKKPHVGTNK